MTRESIFLALFALIQQLPSAPASPFTSSSLISRKLRLWNKVDNAAKPCAFLVDHHEDVSHQDTQGALIKREFRPEIWMYARVDEQTAGAPVVNNMLDAVEYVLRGDVLTGEQTLGGLVNRCYIDGSPFKDPGDIDNDVMAIVPLKILVP